MSTPRPEITDIIARYCTQLSALGIRVDRAILFGSHARGEAKDGSDIDVLIVSSDFETLNTRERMEQLGTKKSCRQWCKSLNGGEMWSSRWRDSREVEIFEQAMMRLG